MTPIYDDQSDYKEIKLARPCWPSQIFANQKRKSDVDQKKKEKRKKVWPKKEESNQMMKKRKRKSDQ